MARSLKNSEFAVPSASRQIGFHQLLAATRQQWLCDALAEALASIDPSILKRQILIHAPKDALRTLAKAGVRDELVFPTPVVLEARPTLVGYYRLLLGSPQKTFYGKGTGLGLLKSMESKNVSGAKQREVIPNFCTAMGVRLAELVMQLSPTITPRDVAELPLLTLGSQLQGSNNNLIGQQATKSAFLAVSQIVKRAVKSRTENSLIIRNAAGREVRIELSNDPDIVVKEVFGEEIRLKVAIEIKGGTDHSNAHNRAGEAEKSHQKAKKVGYRDFWTLIALKTTDVQDLEAESPTTNSWFDVAHVIGQKGVHWDDLKSRLCEVVGIAVPQ